MIPILIFCTIINYILAFELIYFIDSLHSKYLVYVNLTIENYEGKKEVSIVDHKELHIMF